MLLPDNAVVLRDNSCRLGYGGDHRAEEEKGEDDDECHSYFGNELIFSKVFAERNEGGEVRGAGESTDIEDEDEMGSLNFEVVLGDLAKHMSEFTRLISLYMFRLRERRL